MGWAIGLRNKYLGDIFFRTEFNVIFLQVAFALALTILVAISFDSIYKEILQTIITGIAESIKLNGNFTASDIASSIELVKAKNFLGFFIVAVSITLVFGYIIARMTLYPTRNALKSQKRFIGDIAHELRTPLAIIKTNSEVALIGSNLNKETERIFRNNIEELDRVSAIINNLLTFNNLVHPEQVQFASVSLGDVVDSSVKKLDDLIKKKQINLTVKKTEPHSVWGNAIALEQIVTNIIKNAINYNNIGGKVLVTVEPDYRGSIVFTVEDTGIGISQKDLVHIFEPFFRAEKSRNRQYGSSGLGLTIVSELVRLHSGKISVGSYLKQGTTVTILLPYKKKESQTLFKKIDNEVSVDYLKQK